MSAASREFLNERMRQPIEAPQVQIEKHNKMKVTLKGIVKRYFNNPKNGFNKNTLILEEQEGEYPSTFNIEFSGSKLNTNADEGTLVEVECFLNGRAWESPEGLTAFNSLSGWAVNKIDVSMDEAKAKIDETFVAEGEDDLPF